ncbi:MAG: siderophore-interacting protein [Dehalococcoidia bacterium]
MSNTIGYEDVRISGFDPEVTVKVREIVEHANDEHGDTVLLLARYGLDRPRTARDAQVIALDPTGVDLAIVDGAGGREVARLPFPTTATADTLIPLFIGATMQARSAAPPDEPLTVLEEELAEDASRKNLITSVARVRQVSPNIREVTFAGGLGRYGRRAPAEFVNLIVPRPGHEAVLTADLTYEGAQALPEESRPEVRNYTTRAWRPEAGELDIWFVLHDHPGVFSRWVRDAKQGDVVAIRGPRAHLALPAGATRLLCLGDETFLPAAAAAFEDLPASVTVDALIETVDAAHEVPLPVRARGSVRWVHRGSAAPGASSALLEAIRSVDLDLDATVYICGGGEAKRMAEVRKYLRGERGLAVGQVSVLGYWRREES